MLNCLCGSYRHTDWGLVCRQCGKKKQEKKKQEGESFDAILNQLMQEFNNITPDDPKDHHQVFSYRIENGDIIVSSIVYDEEKAKQGKLPKSIIEWYY